MLNEKAKKAFTTDSEAQKKLKLSLHTVAGDDRPVYITGNFNKWAMDDKAFELQKVSEGVYSFEFPDDFPLPDIIEYKYSRGGGHSIEVDQYGSEVPNRIFKRVANLVKDHVPRWKVDNNAYNVNLLPQIQIIDEHFEIPQLIKTRRIAALLPHDYDTSEKHYPVIYLQDGQNLYDDYAPYGNWGLDKRLAVMAEKGMGDVIIIAIDHAKEERLKEFTPTIAHTKMGTGDGKKYVRFLADTLKPYVDQHFRTLPEREHTAVGGSSMGGLISIYAGLMYPEVYGKLLIFSPSLWLTPKIYFDAINFYNPFDTKVYVYAGGKESETMIPNVQRLKKALEKKGIDESVIDINLSIDPQGQHNEEQWGKEFPSAVKWLFFNQ